MDDHVVFFLGSGVSRPSGMPSVGDITQKVLDAPLVRTEHKRYVFPDSVEDNPRIGRPGDSSHRHVEKIRGFLEEVRQRAQAVFCENEEYHQRVTYEDLYALCGEVATDQNTSPSPATRHFSEALASEAEQFLLRDKNNPPSDLFHTANEANFLISGVVREMLSDFPDEIQGLEPLLAAIKEEELDHLTIVTLNHDLLLERLLNEHDISFDDGFEQEEGVRRYSPERLFERPNDVTVIKPHGSINWYYDWRQEQYFSFSSVPPDPELEDYNLRPEPSILSGHRKEEKYTTGIFGDMVDAFILALYDTRMIVESGFGWTDPGMYNHLHRYLQREQENQLLCLHPEGDFSEPHPYSYYWNRGVSNRPQGFLWEELQTYLSETTWDDIKAEIG